jgi:hypothetical protein
MCISIGHGWLYLIELACCIELLLLTAVQLFKQSLDMHILLLE